MTKLTDSLKRDHLDIAAALKQVQDLGINTKEGQDKLLSAKAGLLSHLKNEDQQLYPALRKAAETNAKLQQTLDVFAKEMDKISKAAVDFFEKYAKGGSGLEFAKDFGGLIGTLGIRIRKEETILYAEYDKLNL